MILMIDNYDSFTYNLVQYIAQIGEEVTVRRNNRVTIEEIEAMNPDAIVLSPGPRTPGDAGITVDVIQHFCRRIPMLGVCLGHQSIAYAFGGKVVRADRIMHGKTSKVTSDGKTIFSGLPDTFTAGRYHSLIVDRNSLPDCFEISAETGEGEIMGLRHREYSLEGIQFHPESILTPQGKRIIRNFLSNLEQEDERTKNRREVS